jgi:hypothetical protein
MRLIFDPQGLRPVRRELGRGRAPPRRARAPRGGGPPDATTRALLEELLGYPGVPSDWRTPQLDRVPAPLLGIVYRKGDLRLSVFSTITTFGTPQDVTLQELRIECFFPADEATRCLSGAEAGGG